MKPERRISLAVKINLLIIAAILVVAAGLVGIGYRAYGKRIDDIFATVERVREAGYPIDAEPKLGSDHNWQAWIKDPNGVRIELMQIMPESPQAQFIFRSYENE